MAIESDRLGERVVRPRPSPSRSVGSSATVLARTFRVLALALGFGGWLIIAKIFHWAQDGGGTVVLHIDRVWSPVEPYFDIAAITVALVVISAAFIAELRSHFERS